MSADTDGDEPARVEAIGQGVRNAWDAIDDLRDELAQQREQLAILANKVADLEGGRGAMPADAPTDPAKAVVRFAFGKAQPERKTALGYSEIQGAANIGAPTTAYKRMTEWGAAWPFARYRENPSKQLCLDTDEWTLEDALGALDDD